MPAALKAALEDAAQANKRSITSELVHRLERSFMTPIERDIDDGRRESRELDERLKRIERVIAELDEEHEIERIFQKVVKEAVIKNRKP